LQSIDEVMAAATKAGVNAIIVESSAKIDANFVKLSELVNHVVTSLITTMQAGANSIDVDVTVETLLRQEREAIDGLGGITKAVEKAMRTAAKTAPEALPGLNRLLAEAKANAHREATLYRDARWRLMEARALDQPGQPAGPIKGRATDLDAYLRSLA
jgi:hypothetical protein